MTGETVKHPIQKGPCETGENGLTEMTQARQTDQLTSVMSLPFLHFHMTLHLRHMYITLEKMTTKPDVYGVTIQAHTEISVTKHNYFPVLLRDAPAMQTL